MISDELMTALRMLLESLPIISTECESAEGFIDPDGDDDDSEYHRDLRDLEGRIEEFIEEMSKKYDLVNGDF